MAKRAKAPKGGAPKVPEPMQFVPSHAMHKPVEKPWLTAQMLINEKHPYHHLMFKPGEVKDPEGMEKNESFLRQLDPIAAFSDIRVEAPVFENYNKFYGGHETYEECMKISNDNNLMVLLEAWSTAMTYSDMENEYDRGFVNILKLMVAMYTGNPFCRDRIGWLMWALGKHISPNCYFPLTINLYYDPRLWHRPGQDPKPYLPIPRSVTFDGSGQVFGPEDDIWDCELPDTGSGE